MCLCSKLFGSSYAQPAVLKNSAQHSLTRNNLLTAGVNFEDS